MTDEQFRGVETPKCSHDGCTQDARPSGKTCWAHVPGPEGSGFGTWHGSRWNNLPQGVKELSKKREQAAKSEGRVV